MRVDMLARADQPTIRQLFRQYLDARIEVSRVFDAERDPANAFAVAEGLQSEIWKTALAAIDRPDRQCAAEVVPPALNDMINVTRERKVALSTQMPELVLVMLFGVSLFSALIAGEGMSRHGPRHLVHGGIHAAAVTTMIYTVFDLNSPRGGLIRLGAAGRVLAQLRGSMEQM
jgi:hypothetical protein